MQQQQPQSNGVNGQSVMPDPLEVLPDVIMSYLDYANGLAQRKDLDVGIQGKAMLEMAQALQFLTPLLPSSHLMANKAKAIANQPDPAELQMKAQAHQQDLQMKAQSHQMDMAKAQHELQVKQQEFQLKQQQAAMEMQNKQQSSQQEMIHKEDTHKQDIVHSEEQHKSQLQQQKQAAQQKQSSKSSNSKA